MRDMHSLRMFARISGAQIDLLDALPASETHHYARAGRRVVISSTTVGLGWALVVWYTVTGFGYGLRTAAVCAFIAGAVAAVLVFDQDQDLASDLHVPTHQEHGVTLKLLGAVKWRAVIALGNALVVGEVLLVTLLAPVVSEQVTSDRQAAYDATVAVVHAETEERLSAAQARIDSLRSVDTSRVEILEDSREAASVALRAAEAELALVEELRQAETAGRLVYDDNGEPLTTGRPGSDGPGTEAYDRRSSAAQDAIDRANENLEILDVSIADAESEIDRSVAERESELETLSLSLVDIETERQDRIAAARSAQDAPVGLIAKVAALEHVAQSNLVVLVLVWVMRAMIFAIEVSVLDFAWRSTRRRVRLYHQLLEQSEANVDVSFIARLIVPPMDIDPNTGRVRDLERPPATTLGNVAGLNTLERRYRRTAGQDTHS